MTYKSELSIKLEELPELTLTSVHVGLEEKTTVKDAAFPSHKYLQDNWSVTLNYKEKSYTTNYWQGIGHRKLQRPVKNEGNRYYHSIYGEFKTEKEACQAQWLKLVPPTIADVLGCLLLDSRSAEGTFEDFAGEFGYDIDSRKALDTYLVCQATRNKMIGMLGTELFDALSQLEH